jgi:hypothetical protein
MVNTTQVNQARVFAPIGNQTAILGTSVQFTVSAMDVDGNNLIYSASNLPPGATFNSGIGNFNWTPVKAGVDSITFTVIDGNLRASRNVMIDVQTAVNYHALVYHYLFFNDDRISRSCLGR